MPWPTKRPPPTPTPEQAVYASQRATFAGRVAGFELVIPGYSIMWAELNKILCALGGRVTVAHLQPEPHLGELIRTGVCTDGAGALVVRGDPCSCHHTAAVLWAAKSTPGGVKVAAIGTGYALSNDGMWRQHSWAITTSGRIVETTVTRVAYFGITLAGLEALEFAHAQDVPVGPDNQ